MDLDQILAALDAMPESARKELEATVNEAMGDAPFIPNPGAQTDALLSEADILLYGGQAGGGKYNLRLCKLATDTGFKCVQDISLGEVLLHPSGKTQRVIQLHPWVTLEQWVVHFNDGTTFNAAEGHLWQARRGDGAPEVIETRELKEWLDDARRRDGAGQIANWPTTPVCHELSFSAESGIGSVENRWTIVRNAMDRGGYVDGSGNVTLISSDGSIGDLTSVLRSLGALVTPNREKEDHSLRIEHREPWKLFHDGPERESLLGHGTEMLERRVVDITIEAPAEGRCITVSSPDGLYMADDFVVTHNSALEVGLPALNHSKSVIYRRETTQMGDLIDFSQEVFGNIPGAKYNSTDKAWTWGDRKSLKFAGLPEANSWRKYAGNAKDFMAFDEAGEFTKEQVFSLLGWLRTTKDGQRCRMILGSNPPRGGDGEWMLEEFDPWLRAEKTERAEPGELRWAVVVKGATIWVDGPGEYEINGEEYIALSRTFIPAGLSDNPYLANDKDYKARVMALPEPLRSQLLYGDFTAGQEDHEYQVIPSEWIREAQARWVNTPPEDIPMTAVASDIAQGGNDRTVVQARHAAWFGHFHTVPGAETPDGMTAASEIMKSVKGQCRVVVDSGGGFGGDALTKLAEAGVECYGYIGSSKSTGSSRNGIYKFKNFRAESVWALRDALDPNSGDDISLPPDPELLVELCAFRYLKDKAGSSSVSQREIQLEPKDEIKKRLGRSPDKADTTIMLHYSHHRSLRKPRAAQMRDQMASRPQRVLSGTANLRKPSQKLNKLKGSGRK